MGAAEVVPQGVGIYLDVADKLPSDEVLILDIGFNTIDFLVVIEGQKKMGGTLEKEGTERMLELFRKELTVDYLKNLPVSRLLEAFERGYTIIEGEKIDLTPEKQKAIQRYEEILRTRLRNEIGNLLSEMENVVVAGGGAYYLRSLRPDAIIPDKPEFSQARGYTKI